MIRHFAVCLLAAAVLFACGGATCNYNARTTEPLAPVVFSGSPGLPDVIQAVNSNTLRVQQLQTESASVSTAGLPALRASIHLERPRRFRLRGKLFGPELDLGSNDQMFWFWAKNSPEPGVFFARHDELAGTPAQQMLPIDPGWVIEALGLVTLDQTDFHEGPFPAGSGRVEIRSTLQRASGPLRRSIVVDTTYGFVLEQHLADANGQPLAAARASEHRHYAEAGVTLPHAVAVQLPPANMDFQIQVAQYTINQLPADPGELWSPPQGQPLINLATAQPGFPYPRPTVSPMGYQQPLRSGYLPRYRGYPTSRR